MHRIDLAGFGSGLGFLLTFEKLADSRSVVNAKSILMNSYLRLLNCYECVRNHSFSVWCRGVRAAGAVFTGEIYPISIAVHIPIDRLICAAKIFLIR